MSDPRTLPLASITTWSSGGTPSRTNSAYWGGTIPWISAATLKRSWIDGSDQHLTEAGLHAGSKLAQKGATLVLVRGMALHRETRIGLAQRPVSFNQDVKALTPRPGIVPEFLMFSLQARNAQILELVSSAGSGTGVLNTQLLQRLPIWVPDEHEQRAVIEAVSDADKAIDALERLVAKKWAIKQGMMQQLLTGRTRLPEFADEWRQSTIDEEFDVQLGKRLDAAVNRGVLKTCINNRGVRWGRILLNEAVDAPLTEADIRSLRLVSGDVLMCEGGEVGRSAVWRGELSEAYFLNTLHRLRSKGDFNPYLLVAFFERWAQTEELSAVVGKATLAHLTKENLLRVPVPVPGRDEQERIAAILNHADDELDTLGSRLTKARDIKAGMMQQLLTGRIRLPVDAAS